MWSLKLSVTSASPAGPLFPKPERHKELEGGTGKRWEQKERDRLDESVRVCTHTHACWHMWKGVYVFELWAWSQNASSFKEERLPVYKGFRVRGEQI